MYAPSVSSRFAGAPQPGRDPIQVPANARSMGVASAGRLGAGFHAKRIVFGMLDARLVPTQLLDPSERPPIEVVKECPLPNFPVAHTSLRLLGWAMRGLLLEIAGTKKHRIEQARRLRALFEELGGFWVKVGQLMSVRNDVFSAELCEELSKLQDRASGFPFVIARLIIETELGRPLSQVFDVFEETPFAAASIGQIHRAHLRSEDAWVAVKVRRPFVAETIRFNLAFIGRLTNWLDMLKIRPHARWRDAYWELEHILREEIDYRFEASNIERIRRTLRRHGIFVPKVFTRYSSQRILVMEFIHGALMADYLQVLKNDPRRATAWLEENRISQRKVARLLQLSMLRQALEDNLYHGDLHPGNIILLRNSRIALIDCGTVSSLDREYLQKFRMFLKALAELDYDKASDFSFLLTTSLPVRDLEPMKADIVRSLRAWGARTFISNLPYSEKSVVAAWEESNDIYVRYRCTFDWQMLRLMRAITTLDASISQLYPDANHTQLGRQYFRQAEQRALEESAKRKNLPRTLMNLMIGSELPAKAAELAFFKTSLARRRAKVFEGATSKVTNMFAVLFQNLTQLCIFSVAFIVLVMVDRHLPSLVTPVLQGIIARIVHAAPELGTDTWLVALGMITYLGWTFAGLRRRFERKEPRRWDRPLNA